MALRFKDLTPQVSGALSDFTIAPATFDAGSTVVFLNTAAITRVTDYTEDADRQRVHLTFTPVAGDKLTVYYDDPSISPLPSSLNVAMLKSDYLFGLDLKDQFGKVMSDVTLGNKITIAVAKFEREMKDFSITPKTIKSVLVQSQDPVLAAATDVFEDPYDYDVNDYLNWGFLNLRRHPVISVERIRLIYPTGQEILTYPADWIKLYRKFGQVHIVPTAGSFGQYPLIGQGAMYLPLLSGFLTRNVPALIHADYTAGLSALPDDMKDALYKMAAMEVLKQAGQGKAPGIASVSTGTDGLSESTTLTQSANTQMFHALIKQYEEDVKDFIVGFREDMKGINMRVA